MVEPNNNNLGDPIENIESGNQEEYLNSDEAIEPDRSNNSYDKDDFSVEPMAVVLGSISDSFDHDEDEVAADDYSDEDTIQEIPTTSTHTSSIVTRGSIGIYKPNPKYVLFMKPLKRRFQNQRGTHFRYRNGRMQ